MKYLFLIWMLLGSMGHADVLSQAVQKMKEDAKRFRTYPRIQKARALIARGDDMEAEKLLKKVLSIDSTEEEAANMLVTLCEKHHQKRCIKKYIPFISDKTNAAYYLASMYFDKKAYRKAMKSLARIKSIGSLGRAKRQNILLLQAKISSYLNDGRLKTILDELKKNPLFVCSKEHQDLVSILLANKQLKLSEDEIEEMLQGCQLQSVPEKKRIIWAELARDNGKYELAQRIISGLSDKKRKSREKFLILLAQKNYSEASRVMEALYANNPTKNNAQKLSYLYEKAHNKTKLAQLYEKEYSKSKDAAYMRKLLFLYKNPPRSWLEKYFPYSGLSPQEQYVFLMKLYDIIKGHGGKIERASILAKIESLKHLNVRQKETLAYQYAQIGQYDKAIGILESLNKKSPKKEYAKKLLNLYNKTGMGNEKKNTLILSKLSGKCNKEDILLLLSLKPRRPKIESALQSYLPFACLSPKEQYNALSQLLHEEIASHHPKKVKKWVNRLLKQHRQIPAKTLFSLAEQLHEGGYYTLSSELVKYADTIPKEKQYRLLAENAYSSRSFYSALEYYKKLYQLKPTREMAGKIANLALKLYNKEAALKYLRKTLKGESEQYLPIRIALLAHDIQKDKLTHYMLQRIGKPKKEIAVPFYLLRAELEEKKGEYTNSIHDYLNVLSHDKHHPAALYHLAILYEKKHNYKKARSYMKQVIALSSDKTKYYAQLGYWAQKYHDDKNAYQSFKQALSHNRDPKLYKALGYSAARLDKRKEAIAGFKNALDSGDETLTYKQKYQLKESIKYMEDEFMGYFALMNSSRESIGIPSSLGVNAIGGYASLRLSYVPQAFNKQLQIYMNHSIALKKKSIRESSGSYQPSIGISYQPSTDTSVVVAVESMIKGGDRSRDDVMARISGQFFDYYNFKAGETNYWYKSLYMDLAYFFSQSSYRFYGRYEYGYVHKINRQHAFMPYMGFVAAIDNDNSTKKQKYEYDLALGLSYLFWLNEGRYHSHEYTGRMSVEGRSPLKSNLDEKEQLRLMMEILF